MCSWMQPSGLGKERVLCARRDEYRLIFGTFENSLWCGKNGRTD